MCTQVADVALERMHVADTLAEQRLGWDVELVDVTAVVPGQKHSQTPLVAAGTGAVVARTLDVLRACGARGSLRFRSLRVWNVAEVGPADGRFGFRFGVVFACVEHARHFGQRADDNDVEVTPLGIADLLAVHQPLERAVGVGLDAAVGSATTGEGLVKRALAAPASGNSGAVFEDGEVGHRYLPKRSSGDELGWCSGCRLAALPGRHPGYLG